ncbi:MAG: hypothetical protein N3D84_02900 [Candidatus Woesearchaeota archaeon]|nr:hypothetical protein [Candidatus Woesearchaeota archaeon]
MGISKRIFHSIIGIALIVIGIIISFDFILKFAKFAIGLFLILIGMGLLMKR